MGDVIDRLNKSDARFSKKCPWAVDLENTAMLSARRRPRKTCPKGEVTAEELCTYCTNVQVAHEASKE